MVTDLDEPDSFMQIEWMTRMFITNGLSLSAFCPSTSMYCVGVKMPAVKNNVTGVNFNLTWSNQYFWIEERLTDLGRFV